MSDPRLHPPIVNRSVVWALLLIAGLAVFVASGIWKDVAATIRALVGESPGALPPLRPTLDEARRKLTEGDLAAASAMLRELVVDQPHSSQVLLLAGEVATKQGHVEEALRYYSAMPADKSPEFITGLWSAGGILLHSGRLSECEPKFRSILAIDPKNEIAHRNLAFLLCATGRRFESLPHLFALLQLGVATIEDLLFLGNPVHTVDQSDFLNFARKTSPQDPMPAIGLASVALFNGKRDEARLLLKDALANNTDILEAQALLGRLYVETNDSAGLKEWNRQLNSRAELHPEIWFVRGVWAEEHGEPEAAIRCYWETLRRHPDYARANYRLGQLLVARGAPEWAKTFSLRAEKQEELNRVLGPIYNEGPKVDRMSRAAKLTEELGRLWEAWAWNQSVASSFPEHPTARHDAQRLLKELQKKPPRVIAFTDREMRSELAKYPLPSGTRTPREPQPLRELASADQPIRFSEVAHQTGIDFQYVNGDEPDVPGTPIYQQLGGGIAALDFDRDGWTDLYLSQGSRWPPDEKQRKYLDKLFQNRAGHGFADITQLAGLEEARYSQGACAGDFDNDGFTDLYVANIGGNRLYRNEGDGTFSEVFAEFSNREDWTTSCLIADINGDTFPDVFDVNYLDGRTPFDLVCRGGKSCTPNHFMGQQDQLYLNSGDGSFLRVTEAAGLLVPDGKGLGVVAADFDGTGRLSLFVANDTTANCFYTHQSPRGAEPLQMANHALLSGLAFDRDGRAQACMGVAVDDEDNDGLLDMYVTNFYNESNTLYKQVSEDLFIDATREANLREPSLKMLGFGTQYLDADLDGNPDLVVTNGHVDDYTDTGAAYKMPAQFYRNRGDGKYEEVSPQSLGPFFQGAFLGRSLARLDFNRDGRPDFAVLHLDAPFALLANETKTSNHFLVLHLVGLNCAREAIGTRVTIKTSSGTRHRQLTAGDGFLACNQRTLHVGLGPAEQIELLTIQWPHGVQQNFEQIAVDREWLAVEGRTELIELPGYRPPAGLSTGD